MRGTGRLSVTTNVPGARVKVDGRDVGQAPLSITVVEGAHQVTVSVGDAVRRHEVTVAYNGASDVAATFGHGRLFVRGVPSGGTCTLDGRPLSRAKWQGRSVQLVEGSHELTCEDVSGRSRSKRLDVKPEQRYTFTWPR